MVYHSHAYMYVGLQKHNR